MDDLSSWFSQANTGTVETNAAWWWRIMERRFAYARVVVIRRPVRDVVNSLVAIGFERSVMERVMTRLDMKLNQIARRLPSVLSVTFDDLATEDGCKRLFEHCLPYMHDMDWWRVMNAIDLQIDIRAAIRYHAAHKAQMDRLASIAKREILSGMMRPAPSTVDMTIQQEDFETFYRDGKGLFAEHLMQVGEDPDNYVNKNIELMRVLDKMGAMQITTARSNGRMFGYLMAVISPSLESPDIVSGMHLPFFVSRDSGAVSSLGLKLQRASATALRARGVGELFLRAGTRGSGPRMGSLYRRMGAEPFGELFRLELAGES